MKGFKSILLLIFGVFNCFVFGLFSLLIFVLSFLLTKPQDIEKINELLKSKNLPVTITYTQFKVTNLIYILVATIFFISGVGLLSKKDWARKLTVYFSFFLLLLISINSILAPSLIRYLIVYAIYPALTVFYFTNKEVEDYFKK